MLRSSCITRTFLGGLALAGVASASALTPGNLVVVRVGDGVNTLNNAANPVFLDEYTTAGVLVQSIAMPIAPSGANFSLTMSGTATSEGGLTVSDNGQYLTLGGYDAAPGTTAIAASLTTSVVRVMGRVDLNGNVDTSTSTTSFSGNNIRSVASTNGTEFWAVGANSGVVYQSLAGAGVGTSIAITQTNNRVVQVLGGQLYVSSGSGTNTTKGVSTVGTGAPTTTGQTQTRLPGLTDGTNPSTYGYFFADLDAGVAGVDTLYVADDGIGAITKFCLVSGSWTAFGTVGLDTEDYRGLAGKVTGTSVDLYLSRKGGSGVAGGGEIVSLNDATGYSAFLVATPTLLATATVNTALRGIVLVPGNVASPVSYYCFGDGSGAACPCSNPGAIGNGCANSLNANGAKLTASGIASIAADTFSLSASGQPNGPGLYYQGVNQPGAGVGVVFGDGLRCVAGSVFRLGIVISSGNASTYPSPNPPVANQIPISIKGFNIAGGIRNYQLWYRDSDPTFCSASTFNLTNGVNVTWTP